MGAVNIAYYCNVMLYRLETFVNVQDAELPQLIAFDAQQDLLQVLLANCSYSLEAGRGALIEYDFDGIERQIEDRFLRGRPGLDANQVLWGSWLD